MKANIAVIGCGNMATPLIERMYAADNELTFYTYTPSQARAKSLALRVDGVFCQSMADLIKNKNLINYWILACKPQQLNELATSLNGQLKNQVVISILASTPFKRIEELLQTKYILRLMPNTPVKVGEGILLFLAGAGLQKLSSGNINRGLLNLFEACGKVIVSRDENEFDTLTVFSGSGPGYLFYIADIYYQKLIKLNLGISKDEARALITQLFVGSSKLMQESPDTFEVMLNQVTSKAGVTIAAISELRTQEVDSIISSSIDQAIDRNNELQDL